MSLDEEDSILTIKEEIEQLAEIQDTLFTLSKFNIENIASDIVNSYLSHNILQLVYVLRSYYLARPSKRHLLIQLVKLLTKKGNLTNKLSELPNEILNYAFLHLNRSNFPLGYQLFKADLISPEQLINKIKELGTIYCLCWYAPFIYKYDTQYYDTIIFAAHQEDLPNSTFFHKIKWYDIIFQHYCQLIESYKQDDWKKHELSLEIGHDANPIVIALISDDVESLQEIASQPTFCYNMILDDSIFETYEILQKRCSIIMFAAGVGAVKCFKFLMMNGSSLEHNTNSNPFMAAVFSENYEMIHICQNNAALIQDVYLMTIKYMHPDIAEWLSTIFHNMYLEQILFSKLWCARFSFSNYRSIIEQGNFFDMVLDPFSKSGNDDPILVKFLVKLEKDRCFLLRNKNILKYCAKYNSINLLTKLFSLDQKYPMDISVIKKSCSKGSLEVFMLLLKRIHSHQSFNTMIEIALERMEVNCFKYLKSKGLIDPNIYIRGEHLIRFRCFSNRNIQVIQEIINIPGIDVNKANPYGGSALTGIVNNGDVDALKFFLKTRKFEVNTTGGIGETPLTHSLKEHHDAAEVLICDDQTDLNMPNKFGTTPIEIIIQNGLEQIFNLMLEQKERFKPNQKTLLKCIKNNQMNMFNKIVQFNNQIINFVDEKGNTILHDISDEPFTDILASFIDILIQNGANINAQNNLLQTSLMMACENGNAEFAFFLLSNPDVDIHLSDVDNKTIMHYAIKSKNKPLIRCLMDKGLDFNASNPKNGFQIQTNNDHLTLKQLLKSPKFDVNCIIFMYVNSTFIDLLMNHHSFNPQCLDTDNNTLLIAAVKAGNYKLIQRLTKFGIINYQDRYGKSALFYSAEKTNSFLFTYLLEKGADYKQKTIDGSTILHHACLFNNISVVQKCLTLPGIDLNHINNEGCTAMSYIRDDNYELMKLFINIPNTCLSHFPGNLIAFIVQFGEMEIIRLFLSLPQISKFNAFNSFTNLNILTSAMWRNDLELFDLILSRREVDINIKNGENKYPIEVAINLRSREMFSKIIESNNIELNEQILYTAIENKDIWYVEKILSKKKVANFTCASAVSLGLFDITKLLIENGANFKLLNNRKSIYRLAAKSKNIALFEYLLGIPEIEINNDLVDYIAKRRLRNHLILLINDKKWSQILMIHKDNLKRAFRLDYSLLESLNNLLNLKNI